MELVLAKVLKPSEGPKTDSFPGSVWGYNGNQTGCAITSSIYTPEKDLGTFFGLNLGSNSKKNVYSDAFSNFYLTDSFYGTVNFNKLHLPNPHLHFKGFDKMKFVQQNFYPDRTILVIRKINSNQFDTYFINHRDPSFNVIENQIQAIRGSRNGAVFLNLNFSNFTVGKALPAGIGEIGKNKLKSKGNSQGRSNDPKRTKAIELYAEEYIKDYLSSKGINFVRKYGKPYDLLFDNSIRVEVKGSSLDNIYEVDVTENELLHANNQLKQPPHAIWDENTKVYLAVVESIKVDSSYQATGGNLAHFDIFDSPNLLTWRKNIDTYFNKPSQNPISNMGKAKFKYDISRKITI